MAVYVLLPCYNEERGLGELVSEISSVCKAMDYKMVAVDDGSSDGTYSVLCSLSEGYPLVVLRHEGNRGLHEAMRTLFLWVNDNAGYSDYAITMDSDLTHDPSYIPVMVSTSIEKGASVVIASRYLHGSKQVGVPFHRSLLSKCFYIYVKFALGIPAKDVSSGYRCIRSDCIKDLVRIYGADGLVEAKGFDVQLELLYKLYLNGAKVAEIPFELNYSRKKGRSKMKLFKTILGNFRTVFKLRRLKGEMRRGRLSVGS